MLNKVNLVFNIVLLAAVIFLFFRTQPVSSPAGEEEASIAEKDSLSTDTTGKKNIPPIGSNSRIVYVNGQTLNEEYTFIAEKYEELEKEQMRIESQIERKMRAAEERYRELESQAPTMTPSQMEQAQIELQNLQQDITRFQEKAATDFREKEAETQEAFFKNIHDYLEKFNEEGRYDYILTYQIGGQVLLANDSLDITQQVVDGLNAEYQAGKQKTDEQP